MSKDPLEVYARDLTDSITKTIYHQREHVCYAVDYIQKSLHKGGKILICGNGGSMAEAQHFAAELVVKLKDKRPALASIALGTNASNITACGNDYNFDYIFAREVEALAKSEDSLICLSTSGNSPNIVKAAESAKGIGCKVISMTGSNLNNLEALSDVQIRAQTNNTARAQEVHLFLLHYLAERAEHFLSGKKT